MAPPAMKIQIAADAGREYYTWRGGSIIGGLSEFNSFALTSRRMTQRAHRLSIGCFF